MTNARSGSLLGAIGRAYGAPSRDLADERDRDDHDARRTAEEKLAKDRRDERDAYRANLGAAWSGDVSEMAETVDRSPAYLESLTPAQRSAVGTWNAYQANKAIRAQETQE